MSKINCSLIKDLLPLYIDDLCSKESTEVIGNHLEICEDCNKEYETLKTEPKVKPQQDNSQELIKKVNKKFGRDKKRAVLKVIAIVIASVISVGIIAFFKVPPYIAQKEFRSTGINYPDNYEIWGIGSNEKKNFSHKAVDMYINENFGEYKLKDNGTSLVFDYEDGKQIVVYYIKHDSIPLWDEEKTILNETAFSHFMLPSVIEDGLENLKVSTDVALGYNLDLQQTLIKTAPLEVKFFCSYDYYATTCAYYSCYNVCMPIYFGSQYYLLTENDDFRGYGWVTFKEEGTLYHMEFQDKEDLTNVFGISVFGFTKEEAQEIFEYAVIK